MKTHKRLLPALLALLALGLIACLTGCISPKTKLIDPNMDTARILKAVPFTPQVDGYFVPDARMRQLLDLLSEKDVLGK